jgi:hypothetical protein
MVLRVIHVVTQNEPPGNYLGIPIKAQVREPVT